MKKLILSSVFAFLMIFSQGFEAHAQEFCTLGSYPAGEEISAYIALIPTQAEYSCDELPSELRISETPGDMGKHLSLEGRSMVAGDLNFSINVSESPGTINCMVHFDPAVPQLSISGDINCAVNDSVELNISAGTADNGNLSYQWYTGAGLGGSPIPGATASSYSPDTSQPGQQVYFCEVSNTNNSYISTAVSELMFVTVAEPRVTGIDIESLPEKLVYAPGESLDTKGLSLRLSYDNGRSEVIDSGFELSPARFEIPGKQLVDIHYNGLHCYFEVEVSLSTAVIEGIGVLSLPEKTQYEAGDSLDPFGLVIRVYTADGHVDIDSGFELYPETLRNEGRQSITVTYEGQSCSFTVNVKDSNTLKSVAIASLPIRREYSVGDTVDVSGMSLQLIYGGRTEIVNTGFDWSPQQLTQAGTQEITVSYGQHSAKFTIKVKEQSASPSPTATAKPAASPSPAPESAAPSASPVRVDREHQAKDVNALVKIIFALAVISLLGLGGYIFWMQKRGKR